MAGLPKARSTEEERTQKTEIVVKRMRIVITPTTMVQIKKIANYKTPDLSFSRSVSKDDGRKVTRWLHSHVKVIVFCNRSTFFK